MSFTYWSPLSVDGNVKTLTYWSSLQVDGNVQPVTKKFMILSGSTRDLLVAKTYWSPLLIYTVGGSGRRHGTRK